MRWALLVPIAWVLVGFSSPIATKAVKDLERSLTHYERIAARGGMPSLPEDLALESGQTHQAVVDLRRYLEMTGDIRPRSLVDRFLSRLGRNFSPILFDQNLAAGVRKFQTRHGLEADGIIGSETVKEMNVPVETRTRQIRLNLERLRAFVDQYPEMAAEPRTIWVNIPSFELRALEKTREIMRMRVVIGTEFNPTPIFNDRMTYVEFKPYWNIPKSIAVEEMLPGIQEDLDFLEARFLEVVERVGDEPQVVDPESVDWSEFETSTYDLRQKPGPWNALGQVKFMFPNRFNVYLHDTPADNLFKAEDRTFSHGCIRVERPIELAEFVLRNVPGWNADRIRTALTDTAGTTVVLPNPIPVQIVYKTVWVEPDGALHFRNDVYKLDEAMEIGSDTE